LIPDALRAEDIVAGNRTNLLFFNAMRRWAEFEDGMAMSVL
jgi:hypothetical protein